jgi:hypothetical protein
MNQVRDDDTDSESVDSENAMDLFDDIYEDEPIDEDKIDANYYIGIHHCDASELIMAATVTNKTFQHYDNGELLYYLSNYSYVEIENPKLHIMQLRILPDGTYSVVLKTHWIKLIQRTWRRIFKQRNQMIMRRAWANCSFEINGKWPVELRRLPRLRGSLAHLKVSKYKN